MGEINLCGNVIQLINERLDVESLPQEIIMLEESKTDRVLELGNKIDELYRLSKTIKVKYKAITKSLRDQLKVYDI